MPNVGRPSPNCQACRQRRINCDLKQPACTQCIRKGLSCSGYRDDFTARLHVGTIISYSTKFGTRRHKRRGQETSRSLILPAQHMPSVGYPLTESWESHFFPFYLRCIGFGKGCNDDIYDIIPCLFRHTHPSSALYQACNATARRFLALRLRTSKARSDAFEAYGTVISIIQAAIQDAQQAKSDDTFLGIWLMGGYQLQDRNSDAKKPTVVPVAYQVHARAIAEVIKLRGPEQFKSRERRKLFLLAFPKIEMCAYLAGEEWKEASTWFRHFYRYCDPSEYPILRACIFSHQCSRLCGLIQGLLDTGQPHAILFNLSSILQAVEQVEDVNAYASSYGNLFDDHNIDPPLVPYSPPDSVNDSRYRVVAQFWESWFRARLSYQVLTLLRRVSKLSQCTNEQREIYAKLRSNYIEEILSLANRVFCRQLSSSPKGSVDASNDGQIRVAASNVKQEEALETTRPPGTVTCNINFEQDPEPGSTLFFRINDSGISVVPATFEISKAHRSDSRSTNDDSITI